MVIFIAELRAYHESGKLKAMASKWNEEDSPAIMLISSCRLFDSE